VCDIQQRFINYGEVSKGSWCSFKAKLLKTILDKFFSDDQAIQDLKNDESTDSANNEEFDGEHMTGITDDCDDCASDCSHKYTGECCSFCDERLNFTQSQALVDMRASLQNCTVPDHMPGNPGHRKVKSFTVTIAYCNHHHLEATVFPTAQCQSWPTDINLAKLFDRALLLQKHLQRLLDQNIV
jgi:hypothetical protein